MKEKNSAPRSKSRAATLQKTIIKNKTECTAFESVITIKDEIKQKLQKR